MTGNVHMLPLKEKVDLTTLVVIVKGTRMTQAGDLLVEVGKNQMVYQDFCGLLLPRSEN